ncbi:alcohol dehydrogenase [Lojkania enalia]|uniref:Alcohol dehydrogenase n=1 Tax=Lojkania enalia TaxID=147567 RepID=A0A9P4K807_9PLEO|nr:alcohol dehydrogenase [Didymosphaeria enalia]
MAAIPKTCKAIVIEEAGAPWDVRDVPVREPKEGEILIKVEACGVCHSDSFLQQGYMNAIASFPKIPGHESIGYVVAVGPGEKKWKVGDRAGGTWHGGHDGTCSACEKGYFQMCQNGKVNGVNLDGGYSEYTIIRSEAAVRIPQDGDAAEYAPLLCGGVTVFNGIRKMEIGPGGIVAVQGLGGLGHLAVQYARKMGYRTVALSTSDAKRDFAAQLGATDYVSTSDEDAAEALKKMGGADLVVVTAPNPAIMPALVNGLAPRGKLLILAPVGDIPISTFSLIVAGKSVHGWPSGHAIDCEDTIRFSQLQGVKCMVEKFPYDKVAEAIERMHSNKVRFRGVLTFN